MTTTNAAHLINSISIENDDYITPYSRENGSMYVANFGDFKTFRSLVYNPLSAMYSRTHKMIIIDTIIIPNGQVAWGNTFKIPLDASPDFVISAYLDLNLPRLKTLNATQKVKWVEDVGDVAVEYAEFVTAVSQQLARYTWIWSKVYRELFIEEGHQQAYNEIIGQQNVLIRRIGDEVNNQYMNLADFKLISGLSIDDNAVSGGDVGEVGRDTVSGTTTLGYSIVVLPASVSNPEYGAIPTTETAPGDIVTTALTHTDLDTEGGITYGYNGLQTFKLDHAAQKVTHEFKFWWCRSPKMALALVAIASTASTSINVKIRNFDQMYIFKNAVGTYGGLDTTISTTLTGDCKIRQVIVEDNVRRVYTQNTVFSLAHITVEYPQTIQAAQTPVTPTLGFQVTEMYMIFQDVRHVAAGVNRWVSFYAPVTDPTDVLNSPVDSIKIEFSGNLYSNEAWKYFAYFDPLHAHTRVPLNKFIFCKSFSLYPEEFQPTSFVNFSTSLPVTVTPTLNATVYTSTQNLTFTLITMTLQYLRYAAGVLTRTYFN